MDDHLDRDLLCDRVHELTFLKSVLAIVTIQPHDSDIPEWRWSPLGQHSISSTYNSTIDGETRLVNSKLIWATKCPLKVKVFIWLVAKEAILVWDNL